MADELTVPRTPSQSYTPEEIDLGLTAVALCHGNVTRAASALEQKGTPIPRETLRNWVKGTHSDRYTELTTEYLSERYERFAQESEDLVGFLTELEWKLARALKSKVDSGDLEPRDIANALRNTSTSKGINTDKATVTRGRPTEIRRNEGAADVLRVLAQKFPQIVTVNQALLESTAEEESVSEEAGA